MVKQRNKKQNRKKKHGHLQASNTAKNSDTWWRMEAIATCSKFQSLSTKVDSKPQFGHSTVLTFCFGSLSD